MKIEDSFLGIIPAGKIECTERVTVQPGFPKPKARWLVETRLLIENTVWHLHLPVADNVSQRRGLWQVHAVI